MSNFIDLTGQPFGRLAVLERVENKAKHTRWECQCICGNLVRVEAGNLKSGHTKSCGCFNIECIAKRSTLHGMTETVEYQAWLRMEQRCYNPNHPKFKQYGARGITICDEWRHDFMAFYNYVGKRPTPEHSIDRINNDGNYEPGNVRWATLIEQMNNTTRSHRITLYGRTLTIAQWAKFVGVKQSIIGERFRRYNWPPAKAIFQPVKR